MVAATSATSPFQLPSPRLVYAAGAQSAFDEETVDLPDEVQVFGLDGAAVPIYDLWKDWKAVVAFARHFEFCGHRVGYALCGKRANYLEAKKDVMDASGVSLVLICPGNVEQAGIKIIRFYMEVYQQDWMLSFEWNTISRGGWQQGGIIVAGPGKRNVSYIHKDKEAGDDPDIQEVIHSCCS